MSRHFCLPLLVAGLLVAVALSLRTEAFELPEGTTVLAATEGLRWQRGNMHTHSHWSDGDDYLESIANWYQKAGYQFLVFTDHNVLADKDRWVDVAKTKGKQKAFDKLKQQFPDWVEERMVDGKHEVRLRRFDEVGARLNRAGEFLLIQGEEVSDSFDKRPIHMNASNVKELLIPARGDQRSRGDAEQRRCGGGPAGADRPADDHSPESSELRLRGDRRGSSPCDRREVL